MAAPTAGFLDAAATLMALDTNRAGAAALWRRGAARLEAEAVTAFGQGSDAERIVVAMRGRAVMKTLSSWRRYMAVLMQHVAPRAPQTLDAAWPRGKLQLDALRRELGLPAPDGRLAEALRLGAGGLGPGGARGLGPDDTVRSRSRSRTPPGAFFDVFSSRGGSESEESSIPPWQATPPTPPPPPAAQPADAADSPHALLGVPHDASPGHVRRAWYKAALRTHPDKGGDVDDFLRVHDAALKLGV